MLHEEPAESTGPHSFAWVKAPLAEMVVIASGALPAFVSVTNCGPAVVPTGVRPANASETLDRIALGAGGGAAS